MEPEQIIEAPERPATNNNSAKTAYEQQSVLIPPNRMTPLKNNW